MKCVISYGENAFITVKAAGIVIYSSQNPKKKKIKADKEEKSGDKLKSLKNNSGEIIKILKSIYSSSKKELTVEAFNLYYKFGLGDAALTGIFAGGVYAVFHGLGAFIYSNFKVKKQSIDIIPDFDNNINELKVFIALKLRIINLIKTLFNIILQ